MNVNQLFPIFVDNQDIGLIATKIDTQVILQWNKVANAKQYGVFMRQGTSVCYTNIGTTELNSFAIPELTAVGVYDFKIEALVNAPATLSSKGMIIRLNSDGTITVNPQPIPPTPEPPTPEEIPVPVGLVAVGGFELAQIQWDAVPAAEMYRVYIGTTVDQLNTSVLVVPSQYTRVNLEPNTTYYFAVASIILGVEGAQCDAVSVLTLESDLPAPTNVTALSTVAGEVTVEWSQVNRAVKYNVYTSPDDINYTTHATVTTLTTTLSGVTAGDCYIKVAPISATNKVGNVSGVVHVTVI